MHACKHIMMHLHSFATSNGSIIIAAGGVKTLMDVARFGDRHIQVSLCFSDNLCMLHLDSRVLL
jgi:hypothetical protein